MHTWCCLTSQIVSAVDDYPPWLFYTHALLRMCGVLRDSGGVEEGVKFALATDFTKVVSTSKHTRIVRHYRLPKLILRKVDSAQIAMPY